MDLLKFTLANILVFGTTPAGAAGFVFETGVHTGGDEISSTYSVSSGNDSLDGGDGYTIAAGFSIDMGSSSLVLTGGMKKETIYHDDGVDEFTRYPVNLLFLSEAGKLKYGLGVTYHINPLYKRESMTISNQTVSYKDALGYLLDIRYQVFEDIFIAGRYTSIEYEVDDVTTTSLSDGSSLGLLVGIQF